MKYSGLAVGVAALCLSFGSATMLTGCAGQQVPSRTSATTASTSGMNLPSTSSSESAERLTAEQLLSEAHLPTGAVVDPDPASGYFVPAAGVCGLSSFGTTHWIIANASITPAQAWLAAHPASGQSLAAQLDPGAAPEGFGYVLDTLDAVQTQGLLYTVEPALHGGVEIQVDAVNLPEGATCVAKSASEQRAPESFPFSEVLGHVDASSQHVADSWLTSAALPPGAIRSARMPEDAPPSPDTELWCKPMAHAVGFWLLPQTSADDAAVWLKSHPSPGLTIESSSTATNLGGTIVDARRPDSLEALFFTVVPSGEGSVVRADALVKAQQSVCATAPPGQSLGFGG